MKAIQIQRCRKRERLRREKEESLGTPGRRRGGGLKKRKRW